MMTLRDDEIDALAGKASMANGCNATFEPVLQMLVQQRPPSDVLDAICRQLEDEEAQPTAVYLLDGGDWVLAAKGRTFPTDLLAGIDAMDLSLHLLTVGGSAESACAFDGGWARHIYSGAGELLGLLVAAGGMALPRGSYAAHIDSACHLATLAVEQRNLIAEAAFRNDRGAAPAMNAAASYRELSMQRITEMMGLQCGISEILDALCRHPGSAREDQQVAFYLINGETWTLAAQGDLTPVNEAALNQFDPADTAEELMRRDAGAAEPRALPIGAGWGRLLYSGASELLGMLIGFAGASGCPRGDLALGIESACRLATLALDQRNLVDERAFKAEHDSLTGLYNRVHCERALGLMLDEATRKHCRPAMIYINLDRFRMVNDVLGHAIGDQLLQRIAQRLQSGIRGADLLVRLGGDEFAVLVADARAIEDSGAIGRRLLQCFKQPFWVSGHELFMRASIGIGWASPESTTASLEHEAYLAMRHAKKNGTSRLAHYDASMAAAPPQSLEIEKRLHFALEREEIAVYYQPQLDCATGLIQGVEALIRWRPDGLGVVSPPAFIPILEETGMIAEFGRYVLFEACRQGKQWIDETGLRLRLAVNVAAAQLASPGFVQEVQEALLETGFPAELLELELTESAFVANFEAAARTFRELRAGAGVSFALDDFGTGQSSLSYLHRMPFQRLKIDQSFVRSIKDGEEPDALLGSILRMAEGLGMSAIAEGVETAHQFEVLRRLRCPEAQGYLFAPPLEAQEFLEYYRKNAAAGEFALRSA
jgi:diguanylate cyclase (GGDEF)-like protein